MSEQRDEKPKIIIDEDWKSQVEEERRILEEQRTTTDADDTSDGESPPAAATANEQSGAVGEQAKEEEQPTLGPLPPASFPVLVTSLAAQAMAALGQVPGADDAPLTPQPELARHLIDTLGVLEEKTQGNLTPEEANMLSSVLHQLRMVFVQLQSGGPGAQG